MFDFKKEVSTLSILMICYIYTKFFRIATRP